MHTVPKKEDTRVYDQECACDGVIVRAYSLAYIKASQNHPMTNSE